MAMSRVELREEVDLVSIDPLFIERQRNRYASRAVAYVVWLNGLAAIAVLIGLMHATLSADQVKRVADAMLVFGAGAVSGLASAFFAYVGRIIRLERPALIEWRRPVRWLAILAAIVGAVCFLGALNMVRVAAKEVPPAPTTQSETPAPTTPKPEAPTTPQPEAPAQTPQPETSPQNP
jgi:hypothetical protein